MKVTKVLTIATLFVSAFAGGTMMGNLPSSQSRFGSNPLNHACEHEGQNNCYWNARAMSNHRGKSYIVTRAGNIFYFNADMSAYPNTPFKR